jgi:hypothetical protein
LFASVSLPAVLDFVAALLRSIAPVRFVGLVYLLVLDHYLKAAAGYSMALAFP